MKLVLRLGIASVIAARAARDRSAPRAGRRAEAAGAGAGGDPGSTTPPPPPFEPATAASSVRKVKNLLTGMTPTDDEVALVDRAGRAGVADA